LFYHGQRDQLFQYSRAFWNDRIFLYPLWKASLKYKHLIVFIAIEA
jgi:hypothetical protein